MNSLSFDKDFLLQKYGSPAFGMAYGSGVFAQKWYADDEKPVIDIVFGVDSTAKWHTNNLQENRQDYSRLVRTCWTWLANCLQETGAKIYYHPYIPFGNATIKYGVISLENLIKDLEERRHLYVAGRLHKPVEILSTNPRMEEAMKKNFASAVSAALLLLPENFTEENLYETIAGISYTGDHRMKYGENPKKITNIVSKNKEGFQKIYKPIRKAQSSIIAELNDGRLQQDIMPRTSEELFSQLPQGVQEKANIKNFIHKDEITQHIRNAIIAIVKGPASAQSTKGIFTAGAVKSFHYVKEKLRKAKRKS